MKTYLKNLLEEKNIDLDTPIEVASENGTMNYMTVENVVEFILSAPTNLKEKIRDNFVFIDFRNGDVMHFINYIAKGMAQSF